MPDAIAEDIVTEDTSVPDVAESPAEIELEAEETDTDPMADLEESEINFDDGEDTDDEEDEETEEESESEEDAVVTAPAEEDEDPEEEVEEEVTASEEPPTKEDTPKEVAHEAFKRREAERKLRERDDQEEQRNLDRYLSEVEDDEVELAKRQTEVDRHLITKERVSLNKDKLEAQVQNFTANNALAKNADATVTAEFADAVDSFIARFVTSDKNGNPIEIKVDPSTGKQADVYQYLQKKASSIEKLTGIGARKQTKQKAKEKQRTVTRPTRTPKEPVKDADLDAFSEAFYDQQSLY